MYGRGLSSVLEAKGFPVGHQLIGLGRRWQMIKPEEILIPKFPSAFPHQINNWPNRNVLETSGYLPLKLGKWINS